jgi:pre-mRNA-splicing factor CWC26
MASLEYLQRYLTSDKPHKKRKRSQVKELEATGWEHEAQPGADDEEGPLVVQQIDVRSAGFKPAYRQEEDPAQMTSGARAGLQTKAQVAADVEAKRKRERDRMQATANEGRHQGETVYRDATGRRIDLTLAKREKALEARQEALRLQKEKELMGGVVQQEERRRQQQELEKVKAEPFSRRLNDLPKEDEVRWEDPAAGFLTKAKKTAHTPSYKGAYAPNRFGIAPGYRWDGVDRGNGFEQRRFRKLNELAAEKEEYAQWAKEDM